SAINNAKSALSEAKSASEKYESLGMVKAWGNTSPQNQNMNNWIMSDPAKKAATITCINGVNTIEYTGVPNYEVFNMPISAKIGKKVSVTFSYTQPSVISLNGTKNGIPVSFFETASLNKKVGTSPIYLGTDSQTDKVYTISTIATAETMYLSFNFGYLSDNHHWQFKVSVQQDMSTTTPTDDTPGYVGFANKQSDNPADYTWLRNPDKLEGD
ncbi:hypothetical protein NVV78_11160, partial [Pediococcus ethanolidurans]|uniref:hypothetical protein n=1 Tax=Pediococcus ethanolidurans TaxID=319653 RepID=UPI0021E8232B